MKFKLILILCIAVFVGCSEKNSTLTSPDGEITVNFTVDKNGIPRYNLVYKNDTIILDSRIGLNLKNISLDSALNVVSIDLKEYITTPFYNQEYNMPSIKYN